MPAVRTDDFMIAINVKIEDGNEVLATIVAVHVCPHSAFVVVRVSVHYFTVRMFFRTANIVFRNSSSIVSVLRTSAIMSPQ